MLGTFLLADAVKAVPLVNPIDLVDLKFIHTDHLGTPHAVTDESGTVIWTATYLPFGEATVDEDPDSDLEIYELNLRFPGQYEDAETRLHYNYFRDYDPSLGRYIESDPIGILGGTNTFKYSSLRPTVLSDRSGLDPLFCTWGIGGGVGYYGIGASVYQLNVHHPIQAKTCRYTVKCGGFGLGLPEFGVWSVAAQWDDGKEGCNSRCDVFEGLGKVSFASAVVGVGITIAGKLEVPNGPTLEGETVGYDFGSVRIGTAYTWCYFTYEGTY